jgi:peptidoglycan/LPS O-acetylase OafA/YrhL
MNFRQDINGLRALAVLAVVIFHFNPQWLPGGFSGVDVFFVISGFLMTSIIFNGIEKNTFNLFKFYNARANRIIPVLAVVSLVLLIFGWFYLAPNDYSNLGRQIEKTSYFTSNLLFARESGYFDTAAHTKWLLHTWSLSIEWQFYIFFPIIIIAFKNYFSIKKLKFIILILFISSFVYGVYTTSRDSNTAYLSLFCRAWEMFLGGLAFLYPWTFKNKISQLFVQLIGLTLILISYFLITEDTPWPGSMALIPVIGAYLIVVSQYQQNFILNNVVMQNIGKWSYSIYVWHWPLVVLGTYFSLVNWWIYGIPLALLLGCLSYYSIEKINFKRYSSWKEIYRVKPFYFFIIIFLMGYAVKETDGMKFHYSKDVLNIIEPPSSNLNLICNPLAGHKKLNECTIGNKSNIKAILVGDSHSASILQSVTDAIDLQKEGVVVLSTAGCPYILNASFNSAYSYCPEINRIRFEYLSKIKDTPIFIVNRYLQRLEGENDPSKENRQIIFFKNRFENKDEKYKAFSENLNKTLCEVSKKANVFIVTAIPEQGKNIPQFMARNIILKKENEDLSISYNEYLQRSARINSVLKKVAYTCGAKVLSPADILCKSGKCVSQHNGQPIYTDGDHLNAHGNKLLAPMFRVAFSQ